MPVGTRINQLRVDAHAIASALNTSFQHICDAKLLPDLAHVVRHPAFVWHYTGAADHFQIGNFREVTENLVLHAIGEKGILLFFAQIAKRQHCNAFLRRCHIREWRTL